jgi:hypothetical protein
MTTRPRRPADEKVHRSVPTFSSDWGRGPNHHETETESEAVRPSAAIAVLLLLETHQIARHAQ